MSSTYPEAGIGNGAGVQRGTHLLGDPQVPAKPRDMSARVTTNHRDGQSACPRNGAHPDQKVGRRGWRGGRAVWVQKARGEGEEGLLGWGDTDLLQV